jgi:choline monooxygenase
VELERAETLPARWYWDPAVYERERRCIFAHDWLLLCHESQVAEPGALWAESVAGWPLLLVRGRDGALRGFHNVCRHRAGPLAEDGAGHCRVLRCRYHGWTYELDGRLRSAPDFGPARDFDPARIALHPLRVETWRGFAFANLDLEAKPLAEWLSPFARAAEAVPFEGWRPYARAHHELACNWKTYVENYLEGYHIPMVHTRLDREVVAKEYRVEVGAGYALHHVPLRPTPGEPVYRGFWAWLAPNAALNVYGDGMSVERMLPTGPESMRIDYQFFFREPGGGEAERDAALAMCRLVTDEDRAICEAVQRNLRAGIYQSGRLSPRHENGIFAFQERLRATLGAGE